jgi:hypothetical protein
MDDDVAAEGELYRLQECVDLALTQFRASDKFIDSVIAEEGFNPVAKKMAEVIRKNCGNEASGTFTITRQQLYECYSQMRKVYFNETLERLVSKDLVKVSLDQEGNICFDADSKTWRKLIGIDLNHGEKGGGSESKKP